MNAAASPRRPRLVTASLVALSVVACGSTATTGTPGGAGEPAVVQAQGEALGAAPRPCKAGALRCEGLQPQICDGGTWTKNGAKCKDVCSAGACEGVCKPGTLRCSGNSIETCESNGQWSVTSSCSSTQTCVNGACGAECDVVTQSPCPAADKCEPTSVGNVCEKNGTVAVGGACADKGDGDDCAAPGFCLGYSSGPELCLDFCSSSTDCKQPAAPSGATPEPANVGYCLVGATVNGASTTVCTDACNPVTAAGSNGCLSGLACAYFPGSSPAEYTNCQPPGTAAEGESCASATCADGLLCVSNGTTDVCREVCRKGKNADCTVSGDTCIEPFGITGPMFGVCCAKSGC